MSVSFGGLVSVGATRVGVHVAVRVGLDVGLAVDVLMVDVLVGDNVLVGVGDGVLVTAAVGEGCTVEVPSGVASSCGAALGDGVGVGVGVGERGVGAVRAVIGASSTSM